MAKFDNMWDMIYEMLIMAKFGNMWIIIYGNIGYGQVWQYKYYGMWNWCLWLSF